MTNVVLVNEEGEEVGVMEKLRAHELGKRHRAFSILVFNPGMELLIQQRAETKYHCPKIWSNTVCSHPKPGESYEEAIHRRLMEEMGFDCDLKRLFSFNYTREFANGLIENEHDTVFIGVYDDEPSPDPAEVMNYEWISLNDLEEDVSENPVKYSYWFKKILEELEDYDLDLVE